MKRLLLVLCLSAPFAFFQLQSGCAGQSEGQLCDPNNATDGVNQDCADGLECRSTSAGASSTAGVCCQVGSTHPACVSVGGSSSSSSSSSTSSSSSSSSSSSGTSSSSSSSSSSSGTGGTGGGGTGGSGTGGSGMSDAGDGG